VLHNRDIETRASRTLSGTGRSGKYQDVEDVVKEWILERNKKGLRVKDQYIRAKARRMYVELHMDDDAGAAESDKSADEDVSTLISAHQQAGVPGSNGAISLGTVVRLPALSFLPLRLRSVCSLFDRFSS
jgi:Tc5 transposase DNA-binding domain